MTVTAVSTPGNTQNPTSISASAAATTTAAASATPALDIRNCPGINGTSVTLPDGQEFVVVCETEYSGPVDVGLLENTFQDCIQDCGTANNGFSSVRCRAVTYFPSRTMENNCFFKNAAALQVSSANEFAVSAVLVNNPALNVTVPVPTTFPTPTL